ncbi:MAG TPA: hypothetical protein VM582_03140, partial [Candidatus Thermoplasmatota archaeon]|nr:hypothetical protein [Candidatus Thermoplasmatota archaeon]
PFAPEAAARWIAEQWDDATERVLADASARLGGVAEGPLACTTACRGAIFPADERLVLPGTAEVEVVATFRPPPTAEGGRLTLYWDTASNAEPLRAEVRSGEPFVIRVAPADADAPFQRRSHWFFGLFLRESDAGPVAELDVALRVVARRGPELPAPEAPADSWAAGDEAAVARGLTLRNRFVGLPPRDACLECAHWWTPPPGGIVPPGTSVVRATLAWDWAGPSVPQLHAWTLSGHARAMTLVEEASGRRVFEVDAPEDEEDSPYQGKTLWFFFADYRTHGQSVALVDGTMTLDVVAVRARPS